MPLAQEGYRWWIDRFRPLTRCFDIIRLDHFRGFEGLLGGSVIRKYRSKRDVGEGPGIRFLPSFLISCLGELNIVVENLGLITPEVEALRQEFNFPGMAFWSWIHCR